MKANPCARYKRDFFTASLSLALCLSYLIGPLIYPEKGDLALQSTCRFPMALWLQPLVSAGHGIIESELVLLLPPSYATGLFSQKYCDAS